MITSGRNTHVSLVNKLLTTCRHDFNKVMQETELLSELLDRQPIAAFVIDADHRVVIWNHACELMVGVSRQNMVGRPVDSTMFYPDQPQRPILANIVLEMDENLMTNYYGKTGITPSVLLPETFEAKNELVMKRVNRQAHFAATRLRGSCGHVIGAIETLQDISGRKHAGCTIKITNEAQTPLKKTMISNHAIISHELRAPLNGIIGMASLLMATELNIKQREYVEMLRYTAEKQLVNIRNTLDLSKMEAGGMELEEIEFELEPLLCSTMRLLEVQTRDKSLCMSHTTSEGVPAKLVGDPLRLQQLITNLVGNAIKFTKHGSVSLRIARGHSNSNGQDRGDECTLHFSVTDTGGGIPAEKIDSIFQPFTQVDSSTTRKHGGTGLGLAICSRIVELMGGRIWVESETNKGSTFHFTADFRRAPHSR